MAATVLVALPFYPPAWHAAVRTCLVSEARRHGWDLTIASIDGGPFDSTQLRGLRCRQSKLPGGFSKGTDVIVAQAEVTLAWKVPWFQRRATSWVQNLILEGVQGCWDLSLCGRTRVLPPANEPEAGHRDLGPATIEGGIFARALDAIVPSLHHLSARLLPETFLLRTEDLRLERGRYFLRVNRLSLSGLRGESGEFTAREATIAGPGFENTLVRPHGDTFWKGSRLSFSPMSFGPEVSLVGATLDGSHLDRCQLDWQCKLTALGGEVRGQGAVNFSRERLALEVAASLRGAAVRPLARLLGIVGPADGLIDQGSFTFRGDPEDWPAAQMWLAAHATDFRWGKRRWDDLDLQAVIVNRRVEVHRLELRQSGNRVSLSGECPLPAATPGARGSDALREWRQGGFSCQIDARLEDLRALTDLYGANAPKLAGRMSVNGMLSARPGAQQAVDGYLNVEGSRLSLRDAPLDYLHATLFFRDGGVRVADLQATHGQDYFTGTGTMRLDGPPHYAGELRAEIAQLGVYAPALAGLPLDDNLASVTGLHARVSWDDSVLHFDECKGRFAGVACQLAGTVDLRDSAHPLADLSMSGENVTLRDVAGPSRLNASYALSLRGDISAAPQLGGEVRLLGGYVGVHLQLLPEIDTLFSVPFLSPVSWLPAGAKAWLLDLRITAAAPLSLLAGGEITPDLHIVTKDFDGPVISGGIDVQDAPVALPGGELVAARGQVCFSGSIDPSPQVLMSAIGVQGQPIELDGRADQMRVPIGRNILERVGDDASSGVRLQPSSLPRSWVDDATPAARWPTLDPERPEYALVLR